MSLSSLVPMKTQPTTKFASSPSAAVSRRLRDVSLSHLPTLLRTVSGATNQRRQPLQVVAEFDPNPPERVPPGLLLGIGEDNDGVVIGCDGGGVGGGTGTNTELEHVGNNDVAASSPGATTRCVHSRNLIYLCFSCQFELLM